MELLYCYSTIGKPYDALQGLKFALRIWCFVWKTFFISSKEVT